MGSILVSHRAGDADRAVDQIVDGLRVRLGADRVVVAADAVRPGADVARVAVELVRAADAVVAVIGSHWADSIDADDAVRATLVSALGTNLPVVPTLVDGAHLPPPKSLPAELAPLAKRHPLALGEDRWREGLDELAALVGRPARRGLRVRLSDAPRFWKVIAAVVPVVAAAFGIARAFGWPPNSPTVESKIAVMAAPVRHQTHAAYIAGTHSDAGVLVSKAPPRATGDVYTVDVAAGKGRWVIKWTIAEWFNSTPVSGLKSRPSFVFSGPAQQREFPIWAGPCNPELARDYKVVFELWRDDGSAAVASVASGREGCRADE